jgi:hypothetical protein
MSADRDREPDRASRDRDRIVPCRRGRQPRRGEGRELRPCRRNPGRASPPSCAQSAASIRSRTGTIRDRRRRSCRPAGPRLHAAWCRWSSRIHTQACIPATPSTAPCPSRWPSTDARRERPRRARADRRGPAQLPLPLSAPALRRPAPARRHRPRADARTPDPAARRADLGAGRLRPGRGAEPAPEPESNQRHADFQSAALPTELSGHRLVRVGRDTQAAGGCPEGKRVPNAALGGIGASVGIRLPPHPRSRGSR